MYKLVLCLAIFLSVPPLVFQQFAVARHGNSCGQDLDDLAIERLQQGGWPDDPYVLETFASAEHLCDYGFDVEAQDLVGKIRSYRLTRMHSTEKTLPESP